MMLDAWARSLPAAVYSLIRGGYVAVGTFFVLSGFVLARNYAAGEWNRQRLWRYSVARAARIYPVYALSLAIVLPFILAGQAPHKAELFARHALLLQGWGPLHVGWNTPAWSLSCEAFFYLCFPLAAVFFYQTSWRRVVPLAFGACLLRAALLAAGVPDAVKPLIHFSDFLLGIVTASAFELLARRRTRIAGPWLYLPGLVGSAMLIAWPNLLGGVTDLNNALRPLNAITLLGLALGGGIVARLLSTRVIVYLGKASYAMYILHIPILWWYARWLPAASAPVYVACVILISAAVYRLLEEPANRGIRKWAG